MIPGIDFDFGGGRVYTIAPLTLGALEGLQKRFTALGQGAPTDPANVATVLDAAHAALKRNYPEITRDEVAELVDLGNMSDVLVAVLDVAGLHRKATISGETPPQQTTPAAG
jgi:hypothetical protein